VRSEPAHGRPASVYEADPTSGSVVGIDIGRDWLRLLATDLLGNQLGKLDVRNTARSARALVELTSTAVSTVTAAAGLAPSDVTHTVIGSPGVLDPGVGRMRYAANLPGWQRPGLADTLAQALGTALIIDNDANLAALGEYTYGAAKGLVNFVYLHLGTGVGLGLMLDGRLYRGATGAAGEAGYIPIGDDSQPRPQRSAAPRAGMLEQSLAADAVVRYAHESGMKGAINAEQVFAAARDHDREAISAIARYSNRLAHLVATIAALFDPEAIVVGGGVGQNLDLLAPHVSAVLRQLAPMVPTLVLGDLRREAVVRGAIATGIAAARGTVFTQRVLRGSPALSR
jgi:predicted NBD/HSP70 family sugar kinase